VSLALVRGARESRALSECAKAEEGVKNLDWQPRRTLRRKGSGMLQKYAVKQGRPDAVRDHRTDKPRHKFPGSPGTKSETKLHQESDEVIVPMMGGKHKPPGGKDLCFNEVQREGK
jgi:hypothetical protein